MIDITKFAETLDGKPLAVFGLGISNMAVIKAAKKAGIEILAWDDDEGRREIAANKDVTLKDLTQDDLSKYAYLVLTPAVPLTFPETHPVVSKAFEAGLEIISDIEIFHRCKTGCLTIGVTGTNGKSTTAALITHILNRCGIPTVVGGNIGKAALDLDISSDTKCVVLEVSSFQMEICPAFTPNIAVHLNFSEDHLDRHGSMDNYMDAKRRMFCGQGEAILGVDDEYSQKMMAYVKRTKQREVFSVSTTGADRAKVYVKDGVLFDDMGKTLESVGALTMTTFPGIHNHQNAAIAYIVGRMMGLEMDDIYNAMRSFQGLPHRQFLVRIINNISYVNDSKATNTAAASHALTSYENIYWILGGKPKRGGLAGLEESISSVRHSFLIGDAEDEFASWFDKTKRTYTKCHDLDRAVLEAHRMAQTERSKIKGNGTVLLAPACASFDQFAGFEERGDRFIALVNNTKEEAAA